MAVNEDIVSIIILVGSIANKKTNTHGVFRCAHVDTLDVYSFVRSFVRSAFDSHGPRLSPRDFQPSSAQLRGSPSVTECRDARGFRSPSKNNHSAAVPPREIHRDPRSIVTAGSFAFSYRYLFFSLPLFHVPTRRNFTTRAPPTTDTFFTFHF